MRRDVAACCSFVSPHRVRPQMAQSLLLRHESSGWVSANYQEKRRRVAFGLTSGDDEIPM